MLREMHPLRRLTYTQVLPFLSYTDYITACCSFLTSLRGSSTKPSEEEMKNLAGSDALKEGTDEEKDKSASEFFFQMSPDIKKYG
jgi:hypothetical protein